MEFVDGTILKQMDKGLLAQEQDFIRMMMLLLNELGILHSKNFLHRDIKIDNIMYYERDSKIYFCFIDFGASHHLDIGKKLATESSHYSAPELNTNAESALTDIYSLGKTFKFVIISQKIQLDPKICDLISSMTHKNLSKRPFLKEILSRLLNYCALKEYNFDIFNFLCKNENQVFTQPPINHNFDLISSTINNSVESINNSSNKLKRSNWGSLKNPLSSSPTLRSPSSEIHCACCEKMIRLLERKNSLTCK